MPKIVHLTSVHPAFDTRIFHKECCSLAKAGYEVKLYAPNNRNENVSGVQVIAMNMETNRLQRISRGAANVYRGALSEDADIYHFHDPELIPAGLLLRARGKRVIYDIHEDVPRNILARSYYSSSSLRKLVSWFFEQFENFAAKKFSALIVATPTIGKRFEMLNPNTRIVNNYPGKDELRHDRVVQWNDRPNAAGYVGNLTTARGAFEMVQAMEYVDPSLRAHLEIGGQFESADVRSRLLQLPAWRFVHFQGYLGRARVNKLLSQVRLGLVTLRPEPTYICSQPTKMFEYMSAGIPVLASDFPLWRSFIAETKCGLVVDPLKPVEIGRAIEYLLKNSSEAEEMGLRGRNAVVEFFNWENESPKLLNMYSQLLNTSSK